MLGALAFIVGSALLLGAIKRCQPRPPDRPRAPTSRRPD